MLQFAARVDAYGVGAVAGCEEKELAAFDVLDGLGGEARGPERGE
jgi:hypothetical protein